MIFPDLKLLFIHIPKTGGASITDFVIKNTTKNFFAAKNTPEPGIFSSKKTAAKKFTSEEHNKQLHLSAHRSFSEYLTEHDNLKEYFKFTIIRCPLERFMSAYYYLSWNKNPNLSFHRVCNNIEKLSYWTGEFPDFTDVISSNTGLGVASFLQPQLAYLEPHLDKIDRFFVTENLDEAFKFLSERYGFKYEHLHHNKSDRNTKNILDGKTIKFIHKHYEKDFDLYHQVKNNKL